MNCPSCRSELVVTGQARLETLCEHVFNPNGEVSLKDKFECSNDGCPTRGIVMWDEQGGLYSIDWKKSKDLKFIDDNEGPFDSFERQVNVEINKKNENYDLCRIGPYRFHIKFLYKSNRRGEILKRFRKLEIWIKRKDDDLEHLYISGIRMLLFSIRGFHRHLKDYHNKELKDCSWVKSRLKEDIEFKEWHKKDWWRVIAHKYIKFYTKAIRLSI